MSIETVISAENVSKRYCIGASPRYHTLRDTIADYSRRFLSSARKRNSNDSAAKDFWALKDLNFTIGKGEVVGIIGRNGAGKSTLLKILSRITEPTTGSIKIRGRVSSLLEVGTGFHAELSGRENIFLNGAILGMSRTEIARKFDEIVSFAEVESFLDTPVKHYSSGMYVRLAFAVAAHLEPDILIVDEVLAVGDMEFQRKCLGRMNQASKSGRTILFVSHNLEALRAICQKGILLERGQIKAQGPINEIVSLYHTAHTDNRISFPHAEHPHITSISIDQDKLAAGDLVISIAYDSPTPLRPAIAGIVVSRSDGGPIFGSNMRMHPSESASDSCSGSCTLHIPQLPLHSGTYSISAWLGDKNQDYDSKLDTLAFNFTSLKHYTNRPSIHALGPVDIPCRWTCHS